MYIRTHLQSRNARVGSPLPAHGQAYEAEVMRLLVEGPCRAGLALQAQVERAWQRCWDYKQQHFGRPRASAAAAAAAYGGAVAPAPPLAPADPAPVADDGSGAGGKGSSPPPSPSPGPGPQPSPGPEQQQQQQQQTQTQTQTQQQTQQTQQTQQPLQTQQQASPVVAGWRQRLSSWWRRSWCGRAATLSGLWCRAVFMTTRPNPFWPFLASSLDGHDENLKKVGRAARHEFKLGSEFRHKFKLA